jgi:hypothetical protein
VQDVAHDAHLEPLDASEVVPDGEQVEQRLRRVLVPSVARVDDVRGNALGQEARRAGRPCRMTTMSMRIASRLRAVSTSVSPFDTDEPVSEMLTVSALSRFSANSNEMRVRVEASKKRLTIVLPRSTGTFLMRRSEISLNGSAVSRMPRMSSRESVSRPMRSLPRETVESSRGVGPRIDQLHAGTAVDVRNEHLDPLVRQDLERTPHDVGVDGSSRPPRSTSTQSRNALRPPPIVQLVQRRASGAPGVRHVVDDDHRAVVDPSGGSSEPPITGRGPISPRSSR